ncbi:Riboflavin biosynthesis protein RibF [Methyloligella halotolerans]|uniref:Riboflavin biosynthesis protein n=1 Tax=Methyloligella halotolerans TaxID=1177755 RepID=A0A1E2RYA5_9HYPH|nr:bifunctional riboflavin kinase/FAD synthetase [Methyloligella halotolerans]ODA67201.1 Riboflavin biosynthesis protein RibF [Methyloligella halotolerans]
MDVVHGWRDVPATVRDSVVAIGNFDGVHRGHQTVIRRAIDIARAESRKSGAILFEPHPVEFFAPEKPFFRLTPLPVKLELLSELGLDEVIVLDFDAVLSALSADDFTKQVIAEGIGASHVVVGYDFNYGKGRSGSTEDLKRLSAELGFDVTVVEPVTGEGGTYSSSRARDHLRRGEVREAAGTLGYWWRIRGPVESGAGRGKGLGFPTVNLKLHPGQDLAHGIYAVRVVVDGQPYDAAGYLGKRPTFDSGAPIFEAFLFDFDGDLYGKTVEIQFIDHIREDRTYETPEALSEQMDLDCKEIEQVLRTAPKSPVAGGI